MCVENVQAKEPDITFSLTQAEAKNLISGFGFFVDNFDEESWEKGEKTDAENLLGYLNYAYKCLYGGFAY